MDTVIKAVVVGILTVVITAINQGGEDKEWYIAEQTCKVMKSEKRESGKIPI